MKTTKTFRLLAVLLALMLAFGATPALAVEINSGDYAAWTQSAVDDLYGRLMAAESYEDYIAIAETLSETARTAFFNALSEEQQVALEEHGMALIPESEPFEPIVRFTKVGPLLSAPANGARMMRAAAQNGDDTGSGVVLAKKAEAVEGGYKITLEAYATGSSTTSTKIEPVDIVLVLDVSGSMADPMRSYRYSEVYNLYDDTEYYVLVDGQYRRVYYYYYYKLWYYRVGNDSYAVTPKTSASDSDSSHVQFYEVKASTTDKIIALKSAVNSFIDSVNAKSPKSSIAIVKFAGSKADRVGNDTYSEGKNTYNYSQIVKNLTTVDGNVDELKDAVNSLRPAGATRADYGMEHAKTIINGAANDGRKKVVIMFTDGEPTNWQYFDDDVANDAISASKSIKDVGATVYTIGVFSGANGTPVTSWKDVSDANKYMHLVSSNYKNAKSMRDTGKATYPDGGKSYYLSAGSAGELSSIFQKISQEIGGSDVKLDSSSYILDTVTPYFTMPEGTNAVQFFTMDCNGEKSFDETTKQKVTNVTYIIDGNTLKVTNFDFSANWCGPRNEKYGGKKLIIEFTVTPKADFLGGNNVPTNVGKDDGIYNSENTKIGEFVSPKVNVEIPDIAVTAEDKNVYLLGSVTDVDCKTDATAICNGVNLLDETQYTGANAWKAAFVEIASSVVRPTDQMTEDGTYTLNVTVTPKPEEEDSEGTPATEKTGTASAKINVFKPELTFKDNTVDYKSSLVGYKYEDNDFVGEQWKHGETVAVPATMIGNKPELTMSYAPTAGVTDNIVTATDYVPVKVTVKIGGTDVTGYTTFVHQDCTDTTLNCQWENVKKADAPSNPAFLLHVVKVVGDLTITKNGLNVGTYAGAEDQESAIFRVTGNGVDMTVVVNCKENDSTGSVTIANLPAGTYTVTEVSGWTWRYTAAMPTQTVTVVGGNLNNSVKFTNLKDKNKWLGGDNYKNNVFDSSSAAATD